MKRSILVLVVSLVPGAVSAQETESTWPVLAPPGGSTVYVRDSSGVETSGGLLRLSPDSLVLMVGGAERRFEAARAAAFLISTGTYAAIGTGIDALIPGRTTLYEAPAPPAARRR